MSPDRRGAAFALLVVAASCGHAPPAAPPASPEEEGREAPGAAPPELGPAVPCQVRQLGPFAAGAVRAIDAGLRPAGLVVAVAGDPEAGAPDPASAVLVLDRAGGLAATHPARGAEGPPVVAIRDEAAHVFWSSREWIVEQILDPAGAVASIVEIPADVGLLHGARAARDGWLLLGRTPGEGMEGHLGGSAARFTATDVLGTWRTPPVRGAFLDVVASDGGWLAFHEGVDAPALRDESALTWLDDHLRPLVMRVLAGLSLGYCQRAVPAGGDVHVICPDRVLRFDRSGSLTGALPLDAPAHGAAESAGQLVLLRPEGPDYHHAARPRLCLSFLGHAPSDCFEPTGYERRGDRVVVPVAVAAGAAEIAVAWTAVSAAPRAVHARVYRCDAERAAPQAWAPPPAVAGAWVGAGRSHAPPPVRYRSPPPPPCVPDPSPPKLMPREVTFAEYQRCVAARRCTPPRGRGRPALPVVGVTLEQAAAYCAFAGTRLPADREWTAAATADCTRFPAGAGSAAGRSNCISRESGYALRPPGSTPADVVRGVYDLHANAMEWTADGTVRGSRFCSRPLGAREPPPAAGHDPYVGFRCMAPVAAGAP